MLGSGKGVSGMVGISWNEGGAGTFPDMLGWLGACGKGQNGLEWGIL